MEKPTITAKNIGKVVFVEGVYNEYNYHEERKPKQPKIKLLFVGSTPKDLPHLRIDKEVKKIQNSLKESNIICDILLAATINDFSDRVLEKSPNIIHFSGHGNAEGLYFETESGYSDIIPTNSILGFIDQIKENVFCIVLNSCFSNAQGQHIANIVPYVISVKSAFSDETAIGYSTFFYKAFSENGDIILSHRHALSQCDTNKLQPPYPELFVKKS